MKGWPSRLPELGAHQATELSWEQIWALIVRAVRLHGIDRAQEQLWKLRIASWLIELSADPRTCIHCGAKIDQSLSARATYCSTACRKAAYRCRTSKTPTPFEVEVVDARRILSELRHQVAVSERALRRWRNKGRPLDPPDWTALEHVPMLPRPCTGGCDGAVCDHTRGACLYARTTQPVHDAPEED